MKKVKMILELIAAQMISASDSANKKDRVNELEILVDSIRQLNGEWVNDYFESELKKLRGVK